MEEQREESEFVGDSMEEEEAGKGLGLSSKTETLDGEDTNNTVQVSDSDGNTDKLVSDVKQVEADDDVEETKDNVVGDDVALTDAAITVTEPEIDGDAEVKMNGEAAKSELKSAGEGESVISGVTADDKASCEVEDNGDAAKSELKCAGEGESVISGVNADDKASCEVEDNGDACDVHTEQSQQISEDAEMLSVADKKADQEKHSTKNIQEEGVDSKQENEENVGSETNANQNEEEGEAMEVDYAAEEQVEDDAKVGGALDSACDESGGASVVQTQDILVAKADVNVVSEMEIDEQKDNADIACDLTGTIVSTDLANPNSPSEDAAPGEVEPLDHNALFDPTSDITNFIDFSGVSSWSGNIQDLKTDTRNFSMKEDKKAAGMAEEVATVGIENGSSEARVASGTQSPAAATVCSKEASDAILGSEKTQETKDHECLDTKTADQHDAVIEEEDITHEAPSMDPTKKEDTEMEEDNSDYADDEAGSDIKTNGVKRKADVLSEDSPGEGRKTVSLAKVSFAERPSFKIGACIARAASQMAGSSSVLKGSNCDDDETLSVESFVSQLHCAATDPDKENVVSDIAAGFFLDFRNSSALQQGTPEKVSNKRGRPSNANVAGTEAFEFEEMGDTYWTDRVIHNGGEEQTPPTEKGNYQVVPVELKPAQVQRIRRPYRRRQARINIPLSVSDTPANFDENAPAELVMKFSEADTIPSEKSLSKMFRHFGPISESQTEVDKENNRARVVYRKGADAKVAYNSAGRFSIFGTKAVNYELSYTITETFKVKPYVVSLGEEDAAPCLPS